MPNKNPREQQWESYIEDVQNKTASFCIDMAWHDRGPAPGKSCLWEIPVALRRPRKDGLERSEEGAILEDMSDALESAMLEQWDANMVGWVTRDGWREFYFYMKPPEKSERCLQTLQRVMQDFSDYEFHWKVEHDTEWQVYYSFLYPGIDQLRWIHDRRGIRDLDAQGDIASRYRPIHHWLHFASAEGRDALLAMVEQQEFELVEMHEEEGSDLPYWLQIVRQDKATMLTINAITQDLSKQAMHAVGEYDGWGCKPVKWYNALFGQGKGE